MRKKKISKSLRTSIINARVHNGQKAVFVHAPLERPRAKPVLEFGWATIGGLALLNGATVMILDIDHGQYALILVEGSTRWCSLKALRPA